MTMSKTTNFNGQLIFGQLLKFMSRARISSISAKHDAGRKPLNGKKKGGIKAHTLIDSSEYFT